MESWNGEVQSGLCRPLRKRSGFLLLSKVLDARLGAYHTFSLNIYSNINKWVPLILDCKHI